MQISQRWILILESCCIPFKERMNGQTDFSNSKCSIIGLNFYRTSLDYINLVWHIFFQGHISETWLEHKFSVYHPALQRPPMSAMSVSQVTSKLATRLSSQSSRLQSGVNPSVIDGLLHKFAMLRKALPWRDVIVGYCFLFLTGDLILADRMMPYRFKESIRTVSWQGDRYVLNNRLLWLFCCLCQFSIRFRDIIRGNSDLKVKFTRN